MMLMLMLIRKDKLVYKMMELSLYYVHPTMIFSNCYYLSFDLLHSSLANTGFSMCYLVVDLLYSSLASKDSSMFHFLMVISEDHWHL